MRVSWTEAGKYGRLQALLGEHGRLQDLLGERHLTGTSMSRETRPTCTRATVCATAEWPTAESETRVFSQARAAISGLCRRLYHRVA